VTTKKIKIPFLNKKERKLAFKTEQEKSGKHHHTAKKSLIIVKIAFPTKLHFFSPNYRGASF
jgi:hypothetical protein